jgi:hypothetical protein
MPQADIEVEDEDEDEDSGFHLSSNFYRAFIHSFTHSLIRRKHDIFSNVRLRPDNNP